MKRLGFSDGIQGEGGRIKWSNTSLRERDSGCESWQQSPWQARTLLADPVQAQRGLLCCPEWAGSLGWDVPLGSERKRQVCEPHLGSLILSQQLDSFFCKIYCLKTDARRMFLRVGRKLKNSENGVLGYLLRGTTLRISFHWPIFKKRKKSWATQYLFVRKHLKILKECTVSKATTVKWNSLKGG